MTLHRLKIRKLREDAVIPRYAHGHEEDAGMDLHAVESVTLGYRVLPVDGFPIVGFPERRPNLYIAAMHSGMTMCPIIGQLAAMEILDGVTVDLLASYRLSRFTKHTPA